MSSTFITISNFASISMAVIAVILTINIYRRTKKDSNSFKDALEKIVFFELSEKRITVSDYSTLSRFRKSTNFRWWLSQFALAVLEAVWLIFAFFKISNVLNKEKHAPVKNKRRRGSLHRIVTFWELFQYILPPKTRREAFEPAYNDLKADYLISLRYRSKWIKRWFCFCFVCRTFFMVGQCFWVAGGSKLKSLILILVPATVRKFFIG